MLRGVGTPGTYGPPRIRTSNRGQHGSESRPRPPREIVEPSGSPPIPPIPGRLVPDHRVEGVHGPEPEQPGHTTHGPPHQGPDHRIGRVLGNGLHNRPRNPVGVEGLRIPPAQMRQPSPRRVDVPRLQRPPDAPSLPGQRSPPDHGPGGRAGQRDGSGRGRTYDTSGHGPQGNSTPGTHDGVQRAPPSMVAPQNPFHGARGPPEHGDRMPPAGITEEQVTEKAGGGAVREDAIGTHELSRPLSQTGRWC